MDARIQQVWAGDMQVGLCLRRHGVIARHVDRTIFELHFITIWPSKELADSQYSMRWRSEEDPVTCRGNVSQQRKEGE